MITLPLVPEEPPALVRPVITNPRPREVSFGTIAGRASAGVTRIVVRVDGVTKADVALGSGRRRAYTPPTPFRIRVQLPPRDVTIRVLTYNEAGESTSRSVRPVYGLPQAGFPVPIESIEDPVLARRIKEQCGETKPPLLIAVTGYGRQEDQRRSAEAGIDLHLTKPVDPEGLRGLLNAVRDRDMQCVT